MCGLFGVSENEGTSAVQMSYADRLRLSALTKQVSHGAYSAHVATDVGLLDVFGNDRRYSYLLAYCNCVYNRLQCECCCVSRLTHCESTDSL